MVEPDPIGFAGGSANLYAYVDNDPVNYIDPDGLKKSIIDKVKDALDFSDFLEDFRDKAVCWMNPSLCDKDEDQKKRDLFPVDEDEVPGNILNNLLFKPRSNCE